MWASCFCFWPSTVGSPGSSARPAIPWRCSLSFRWRPMPNFSCARSCSGGARLDDLMVSQLILPIEPASRMTRDDLIVASGNRHALAFLDAWPDWPMPAAALYGPSASGKTHLARIWALRAGAALADARELAAPIPGAAVVENCDSVADHAHESALFAMLERGTPLL